MGTPAVGFRNGDLICRNISFDYTLDPPAAEPGIIMHDGQLLIGCVDTNPTPNIAMAAGRLTSPDASVSIGYTYPNITLMTAGGGGGVNQLTPDVGGPVVQFGGNINVNGLPIIPGQSVFPQAWTTNEGGSNLQINAPNCCLYIVDQNGYGTHTSIASAIVDASALQVSSGVSQTIFIRPGVYTENLTMRNGVNLTTFNNSLEFPANTVQLIGQMNVNFAGACNISGMRLTTNGSQFLNINTTSFPTVTLSNCFLDCANAFGITATVNCGIYIINCFGDLGVNQNYFTITQGSINFRYCRLDNGAFSNTRSTVSNAALFNAQYCIMYFGVTTFNGSFYSADFCGYPLGGPYNYQTLIAGGTSTHRMQNCWMDCGSMPAITVNAGAGVQVNNCSIDGSGVTTISGAGGISYTAIAFPNICSTITVTGQTLSGNGPKIRLGNLANLIDGAGNPNGSLAAPRGSLFLRTDGGASVNNRAYINTNGGTSWTAILTAG